MPEEPILRGGCIALISRSRRAGRILTNTVFPQKSGFPPFFASKTGQYAILILT